MAKSGSKMARRLFAAAIVAVMTLLSGPSCLMLGPNSPFEAAHEDHHAHGADSHSGAHHAQTPPAELKHHCQCPAHRGVAPSGSVVFAAPFLVSPWAGSPIPIAGFWLEGESKPCLEALSPGPACPVPIFLS